MAITVVGSGTASIANNASVTPAAPAGLTAGDLVIILATIRNSGVGTVNTPGGWTLVSGSNNVVLFARIWTTSATMPTISFTGGVANADTMAQAIAFRGTERSSETMYAAGQLNASAQDIAYPALDVTGPGQAVVIFAWKQDDSTGYGTPAGFTGVPTVSTTTGDDASQAIRYQIQTTETDIAAGSITVTGGAAAISRAITLAIRRPAQITATVQNTFPPRVLVTVSDLAIGDDVVINRWVDGVGTPIRSGTTTSTTTAVVVVDAEAPFNDSIYYEAVINELSYTTSPLTLTLPGGKNVLTDPTLNLVAEVVIQDWPEKRRERRNTTFRVGARNIVVSGPLGQAETQAVLYTETDSSAQTLVGVLEDATGGVVQIREGSGASGIDGYYAVTAVTEQRYLTDVGADERRLWTVELTETDPWAPELVSVGYTYQQAQDFYVDVPYSSVQPAYATYLDAEKADFS